MVGLSCSVLVGIAGCGGSASSSSNTHSKSVASNNAPISSGTASSAPASTAPGRSGSVGKSAKAAAGRAKARAGAETFGSEASAGARAAILTALHSYLGAIAAGDWPAACGQLSASIQHQLELVFAHAKGVHGRGCAPVLGALLAHTPPAIRREQAQLSVLSVRASGNQAIVLYRSPQSPDASISMFREAGHWKAGVLAASAG